MVRFAIVGACVPNSARWFSWICVSPTPLSRWT
jgi:hypothetical protein